MKIVLINPPRIYRPGSKGIRVGLPMGLMYIAALLEKNNYEVKIFDSLISLDALISRETNGVIRHGVKDENLIKFIKEENPDIVGISSSFTAQIPETIRVLKLIKENFPSLLTMVGGPHFSVAGLDFIKENPEVDIVILGEGETTALEILNVLKNKKDLGEVKGIIFRDKPAQTFGRIDLIGAEGTSPKVWAGKNNNIIKTGERDFIKNLDELPMPAYHLIDMPFYFKLLEQGYGARVRKEKRSISMITSRGCPFDCVFCSIHLHMGCFWRAHSAQYVLDHIDFLVKNYQIKHISFEDDNLILNKERFNQILDGLIERDYKITWDTPNGVRAENLMNEDFVAKMKEAGCIELIIGVESGVQKVLDKIINKNLKLSDSIAAAKICRKLKIPLKSFFVIGFPGETVSDMRKTIKFALMLRRKYKVEPGLMIATPLFGTRLYEICEKENLFVKKPDPDSLAIATQTRGEGLIRTKDFAPSDLKKMNNLLQKGLFKIKFLEMIINPIKFLKYVRKLKR